MNGKPYIIAFTGHRPQHLTSEEQARAREEIGAFLEARLQLFDPWSIRVLVGGAMGVDDMARLECMRLDIPYTLCIPHKEYRRYWEKEGLGEYYDTMLQLAPKVVCVVPDSQPWHFSHNFKRNEYMVKWCDELCAVFKGKIPEDVVGKQGGGTRHCIEAALKVGKCWYHIDPRQHEGNLRVPFGWQLAGQLRTQHERCDDDRRDSPNKSNGCLLGPQSYAGQICFLAASLTMSTSRLLKTSSVPLPALIARRLNRKAATSVCGVSRTKSSMLFSRIVLSSWLRPSSSRASSWAAFTLASVQG